MARGKRSKDETKPDGATPPKNHNRVISDETIQHHLNQILPARAAHQDKMKEAKELNGAYRAALKDAKKDGAGPEAIRTEESRVGNECVRQGRYRRVAVI